MATRLETARAKVGAALLDVIRPGWAHEINLARLDLGDCDACVLGQMFGRYGKGVEQIFAVAASGKTRDGNPPPYAWCDTGIEAAAERAGFVLSDGGGGKGPTYSRLTDAWKREIKKRQQSSTV